MSSTKPPVEIRQPSTAEAEALIREARKRQRRRRLVAGAVAVVVLGGVVVANSVLGGAGHPSAPKSPATSHPRPAVRPVAGQVAGRPGPTNSTVLMWPVGTVQNGTIYLDNLRTGRLGSATPVVDPGEYQPIMLVGGRIIYVTNGGVWANDVLTGKTLSLGHSTTFAPAARPGQVWLEYGWSGRVVRPVSVQGGRPGPRTVLPRGSQLIAGTDAGLLLQGEDLTSLWLWKPGTAPRRLPHSRLAQAFAVSPRMVAYDTGCADEGTSPSNIYGGNYGYSACTSMRVLDVVTGRLRSFRAPPGTIGWAPSHGGYWSASAMSSAMIAAKAVVRPASQGMAREFVLPLTSRDSRATVVPYSAAFLLSVTAWSTDGSWLFYQGPGEHMWAYQVRTGKVRSSRIRCCQYATMATFK